MLFRSYRVTDPAQKPVIRYYSMPYDQSETPKPVAGADGAEDVEYPGPRGKYLAYVRGDSTASGPVNINSDILIAPLDSPQALRPLASNPEVRERMPRFSPDGQWLAFNGVALRQPGVSNPTALVSILYVRPVQGGALTQVSIDQGNSPMWSRDGKTLYYFSGGGTAPLIAAHVSVANGQFVVGPRDTVFTRGSPGTSFWRPDGRSLADILPAGDIVYVTNATPTATTASSAAPPPAPVFQSNLIAIVNWLGLAAAGPPR